MQTRAWQDSEPCHARIWRHHGHRNLVLMRLGMRCAYVFAAVWSLSDRAALRGRPRSTCGRPPSRPLFPSNTMAGTCPTKPLCALTLRDSVAPWLQACRASTRPVLLAEPSSAALLEAPWGAVPKPRAALFSVAPTLCGQFLLCVHQAYPTSWVTSPQSARQTRGRRRQRGHWQTVLRFASGIALPASCLRRGPSGDAMAGPVPLRASLPNLCVRAACPLCPEPPSVVQA